VAAGRAELTSVAWLCLRDRRLLCVRSRDRDRFYLPGGKPEGDETLEQALVREAMEEVGISLADVRFAFAVQAPAHGQPEGTIVTMHCFYAEGPGEPRAAREIAELAWFAMEDRRRAAPAVQRAMDRLEAESFL
jgi:8-oxo-dGTP diphosphatase